MNGEDFAAFLLTAVQDFLLNAERMIFHLQLIAVDLSNSCLMNDLGIHMVCGNFWN